jgi:hypothetical protein
MLKAQEERKDVTHYGKKWFCKIKKESGGWQTIAVFDTALQAELHMQIIQFAGEWDMFLDDLFLTNDGRIAS